VGGKAWRFYSERGDKVAQKKEGITNKWGPQGRRYTGGRESETEGLGKKEVKRTVIFDVLGGGRRD